MLTGEPPLYRRVIYSDHIVITQSLSHFCTFMRGTRDALLKSYQMKQSMKVSPCGISHGVPDHFSVWSGKDSRYATISNEKSREIVQSPSSRIEVFLHFFQLTLLNRITAQDKNEVKQKHTPPARTKDPKKHDLFRRKSCPSTFMQLQVANCQHLLNTTLWPEAKWHAFCPCSYLTTGKVSEL